MSLPFGKGELNVHPRAFAERTDIAQRRQQAAAAIIAERLGIVPPAKVAEKDAAVRRLKEDEALADWLESVAAGVSVEPEASDLRTVALGASDDDLKALGLSATAIKKLRDGSEEE